MRGSIRVAPAGHGGMGHLLVLLLLVGCSQFQRVEGEQQLCESKIVASKLSSICIGHNSLPLVRQLEGQRQCLAGERSRTVREWLPAGRSSNIRASRRSGDGLLP